MFVVWIDLHSSLHITTEIGTKGCGLIVTLQHNITILNIRASQQTEHFFGFYTIFFLNEMH
jgi:hypothetical protein